MKRKIILILVVISVIFAGAMYLILNFPVSSGVRSGKLVKISKKGVAYRTYEGTLDLGSGDALTWDFSVHDDELGEKLVRNSGKQVRLEYRELLFKVFYSTKYDVIKWEEVFTGEDPTVLLCRLVDIMRQNASVVNFMRPLIQEKDPDLLDKIRNCQN